jgi:hypothetical protein
LAKYILDFTLKTPTRAFSTFSAVTSYFWYENVGCFYTDNSLNVFTDSITLSQCRMAETKGLPLVCYIGEVTHFLDSHLMTIELCLEMCITTYGFHYAGLAEYIFF